MDCSFLSFSGVMAYALAVLLGITSLPSVTNVLTWKEFGFVQSKLGWLCLLFACAHDIAYGWPYMWSPSCKVPPTFQVRLHIHLHFNNLYKQKFLRAHFYSFVNFSGYFY